MAHRHGKGLQLNELALPNLHGSPLHVLTQDEELPRGEPILLPTFFNPTTPEGRCRRGKKTHFLRTLITARVKFAAMVKQGRLSRATSAQVRDVSYILRTDSSAVHEVQRPLGAIGSQTFGPVSARSVFGFSQFQKKATTPGRLVTPMYALFSEAAAAALRIAAEGGMWS